MKQINLTDNKGISLLELIVSILVASILISMLMSLLTMALNTKVNLDVQNKMANESTVIVETIRFNLLQMDSQKFEVITDDANELTIRISQIYEAGFTDGIVDFKLLAVPIIDGLKFDKVAGAIYYSVGDLVFTEDERISSNNIFISEISNTDKVFELVDVVTVKCLESPVYCTDILIKVNLSLAIVTPGGPPSASRIFRTSIII